jgi:hypothetical protein
MKNKKNQRVMKLVVISIFITFLTTSVTSAMIKNQTNNRSSSQDMGSLSAEYYEWRDDFNNEQKIDMTKSWGYIVEGGVAKMKNTYPVWTDPAWKKLVPISVKNSGGALTNYALNFIVEYDSDMQPYYDDIRFKHENTPTNFLDYWIESYDSTQASVWVKVPSLPSGTSNMYLFYGNPNANSESNFGNVFTDWDEKWSNDEQITLKYKQEGCWDPDVSYGYGEFLVCWEQGMPYWPAGGCPGFRQEIRASIYEPDGDRLVYNEFVYKDSGVTYWRNEDPSIAYGGGKWFVAWEHYEPVANPSSATMDIYARTVKRSGSELQLGSLIYVCTAQNCQADPNVEFDSINNRFMVVWEDARDGMNDYDIRASLYSTDGSVIVDNKLLCNDANSQCEPWAAYDPGNEQYLIVWEEGVTANNGPFRIMGGIFDEDLNTISTFTVAEPDNYPNEDFDYNFPYVEFDKDSERYLVTWQDDDISDGDWRGSIYGKIYNTAGTVKVDKFTIINGNFERAGIVPYLNEAFLVAYDSGVKVYGKMVTSEGYFLGGDVQLSASPSAQADWTSLATDGSKIFVAWEDTRIEYEWPYDSFPDVFGNLWNLNIPDGSEITITFGQEKELVLEAQVTSKEIEPSNLENWHQFLVDFDDSITFDILDGTATTVLIQDADNGEDLSWINPNQYPSLTLRAHFTRSVPSSTPTLNWWSVLYEGTDTEPPVTGVNYIDGILGLKEWYTSECVTIWLDAIDNPPDTGSGVEYTYYTIDSGQTQIYDEASGIHICSYEPNWYGTWVINFWSVDYKGNVEDRTKPENYRTIKIDARRPEVWISSPTEEAEVEVPFLVIAEATDNAGIERVDFDIEPFGQRPGLPWSDYTPPYEWLCNEKQLSKTLKIQPSPTGVMVQIRATAYDESGQYWLHEIFIQITNWKHSREKVIIHNYQLLLEKLMLGFSIDDKLNIEISKPENSDLVKFTATKIFTGKQTTIIDNDFSDGCSASLNIPTGFYNIKATTYKEGKEISSDLISRVFFIHR